MEILFFFWQIFHMRDEQFFEMILFEMMIDEANEHYQWLEMIFDKTQYNTIQTFVFVGTKTEHKLRI